MISPDLPPPARRTLRARATVKAGAIPCPGCGGADSASGLDEVCDCGAEGWQLQARCLRNAREAS